MAKFNFYLFIILTIISCNSKNKTEDSENTGFEEIRTDARFISSEKLFEGEVDKLNEFERKLNLVKGVHAQQVVMKVD